MAKKKKRGREAPPVQTGHDGRPEESGGAEQGLNGEATAPDGISGDWG